MTKLGAVFVSMLLLLAAIACSKQGSAPRVVVEIPPGFSGNFVLNMGVRTASPLPNEGGVYLVTVPKSGRLNTSTFFDKPAIEFKNASGGSIRGFSQSVFTTGDGISVGGKIEFFVGTQQEFEAEQKKKNNSGRYSSMDAVFPGA